MHAHPMADMNAVNKLRSSAGAGGSGGWPVSTYTATARAHQALLANNNKDR